MAAGAAVSKTPATVPSAIQTAFVLYQVTVLVSLANAVARMDFGMSSAAALLNPALELLVFVGVGLRMRAGRPQARIGLLTASLLLILLNLLVTYGLTQALGSLPTYQAVVLWVLAGTKVALLAAAAWMMYRPGAQRYFVLMDMDTDGSDPRRQGK
ncbi:MAG TPA: hypothetical protein VIQ30_01355 [Pseudonocardia sp.]